VIWTPARAIDEARVKDVVRCHREGYFDDVELPSGDGPSLSGSSPMVRSSHNLVVKLLDVIGLIAPISVRMRSDLYAVHSKHLDNALGSAGLPETLGGCWARFSNIDGAGYRALTVGEVVDLDWEQYGYPFRAILVIGWTRSPSRHLSLNWWTKSSAKTAPQTDQQLQAVDRGQAR
jgi:CspA family cold shock protein